MKRVALPTVAVITLFTLNVVLGNTYFSLCSENRTFYLTKKYMKMFTLLLGDQSCEVQLGNEPEEGQGYCTSTF